MNVVIVDNEINALNYLVNILNQQEDLTIQNTFTDSIEALVYLLKNETDAVFLDIEMPNINGMYLAEQITSIFPMTNICFVTAYHDFAVRAFEINAIDYILKPYSENRVLDCIKKMSTIKPQNEVLSGVADSYKYELDMICGYDDEDVVIINYQDIYYIEVVNRNIFIHMKDKLFKGNKPLSFYEDKFRNHSFFRVHKCYIVNLEKISRFKPRINYTYDMYFKDINDIVPLSRNKVKELKTFFDI
jgi:two-component system, LytTR family, response regulator